MWNFYGDCNWVKVANWNMTNFVDFCFFGHKSTFKEILSCNKQRICSTKRIYWSYWKILIFGKLWAKKSKIPIIPYKGIYFLVITQPFLTYQAKIWEPTRYFTLFGSRGGGGRCVLLLYLKLFTCLEIITMLKWSFEMLNDFISSCSAQVIISQEVAKWL